MSALFVTATGTDSGKTFVSAGLLRHVKGLRAFKPVVSGFDIDAAEGSDPAVLLQAMGEPVTRDTLRRIAPLQFRAALAPTMAARRENYQLGLDELTTLCRAEMMKGAPLLIEGAGGLMSPLAEGATNLDLMRALQLPCLLVCGSYLGAISHTLTALETLRAHRLRAKAVVLNESLGSSVDLIETAQELQQFVPHQPITLIRRDETRFDELARICGF